MNDDTLIFLRQEDEMDKNPDFLQENLQERMVYFTRWVDDLVDNGGYTYLEAIADFADKHDIEYEKTVKYISGELKQKIYQEAVKLNMIKNNEFNTAQPIF